MKTLSLSLLLAISFLALPAGLQAQGETKVETAGLVSGGIWFSKEPLTAGMTVRINALVYNSGGSTISGKVSFYDGAPKLGEAAFGAVAPGASAAVSVPWKVSPGYHKIYAVISSAALSGRAVIVEDDKTLEREIYVPDPAEASSATGTVRGYVGEKFDIVREYGEKNLPEPVTESIAGASGALERLRESAKSWADEKGVDINAYIQKGKTRPFGGEEGTAKYFAAAKTPLAYAGAFALDVASLVFGNRLFFYGGLFVILLYIIRFVKRVFFFR